MFTLFSELVIESIAPMVISSGILANVKRIDNKVLMNIVLALGVFLGGYGLARGLDTAQSLNAAYNDEDYKHNASDWSLPVGGQAAIILGAMVMYYALAISDKNNFNSVATLQQNKVAEAKKDIENLLVRFTDDSSREDRSRVTADEESKLVSHDDIEAYTLGEGDQDQNKNVSKKAFVDAVRNLLIDLGILQKPHQLFEGKAAFDELVQNLQTIRDFKAAKMHELVEESDPKKIVTLREDLRALALMKDLFNKLSSALTGLSFKKPFVVDSDLKAHHIFKDLPAALPYGSGNTPSNASIIYGGHEYEIFLGNQFNKGANLDNTFYDEFKTLAKWTWLGSSHKAGAYIAELIHVAFNGTQEAYDALYVHRNTDKLSYFDSQAILGIQHPVESNNGWTLLGNWISSRYKPVAR